MTDRTLPDLIHTIKARLAFLDGVDERKRIRQKAGVSLREIADAIGVSHMTISNWEKGAKPHSQKDLDAYLNLIAQIKDIIEP